jgi:proline dehydrogenase
MLLRDAILFLSRRRELEEFLRSNPLAKQARDLFIAGETRTEALAVAKTLNQAGYRITLDYLALDPQGCEETEQIRFELQTALQEMRELGIEAGLSVKLSHLGLRLDPELATRNLTALAAAAAEHNRFVRVDMEEVDTVDQTLEVVCQLAPAWDNLGTVVQSYLRRSEGDIEALNARRIPVRLVRGMGLEGGEGAFRTREEADLYFMRLVETLMRDGHRPAIATHSDKLIEYAVDMAFIFGLEAEDFEFQLLYGFRRDLQQKLLAEGHRVRIYLPYGPGWFNYFMRRIAERPATIWYLMQQLRKRP